jgi:hypothetical protein
VTSTEIVLTNIGGFMIVFHGIMVRDLILDLSSFPNCHRGEGRLGYTQKRIKAEVFLSQLRNQAQVKTSQSTGQDPRQNLLLKTLYVLY